MGLSFEKYQELKKQGRLKWDTDRINNSLSEADTFLKGVQAQSDKSAARWSPEEYQGNTDKLNDLKNSMEYLSSYAKSLKGTDGYDKAINAYNALSDGLKNAEGYMKRRAGAYSDNALVRIADEAANEAVPEMLYKGALETARKQAEQEQREQKYGRKTADELIGIIKNDRLSPGMSATGIPNAADLMNPTGEIKSNKLSAADKEYIAGRILENGTEEQWQELLGLLPMQDKELKASIQSREQAQRAINRETEAAQRAARLDDKYTTKEQRLEAYGSDRENRAIKDIYKDLKYLDDPKNANEKETYMSTVVSSVAERYGMSRDEAKELVQTVYEGKTGQNNAAYEKMAAALKSGDSVSDEDRQYLAGKIIEDSSVEELQQLVKDTPQGSEYDNALRKTAAGSIEAKGEEQYYHDIVRNDVKSATVIQKWYDTKQEYEKQRAEYNRLGVHGNMGYADKATAAKRQEYEQAKQEYEEAQKQFEALKDKGYDTGKIEKYYTRYREHLKAEEENKALREWTAQSPFNAALASVGSIPLNMIGSVVDTVRYAWAEADSIAGGDGYLDPATTLNKKVDVVRGTVNDMIGDSIDNDAWRTIAQFLYGSAMSGGDMLAAFAVDKIPLLNGMVGKAASSAMFFSSAGVNAANEVLENGGTIDQAGLTLVSHGLNELIFERLSLENLAMFKTKDPHTVKEIFKNILKQTITEGSEEVATDLANDLADAAINGDLSRIQRRKQEYINSGMTEQEAEAQVKWDLFGQTIESFAGGALMGGIMGGGQSIANYRSRSSYYRDVAAKLSAEGSLDEVKLELIKEAQNSQSSKAVKMAESFNRTIERNGGKLSSITEADVANLMQVLDTEALTAAQFEAEDKAAFGEEGYHGYDEYLTKKKTRLAAKAEKKALKNTETAANITAANAAEATAETAQTAAETEQAAAETVQTAVGAGQGGETVSKATPGTTQAKNAAQTRVSAETEAAVQDILKNGGEVSASPFGYRHKNGLSAVGADGKEHVAVRIESVGRDYGQSDNTVVLKTADGQYVNADEVTVSDPDYSVLLNMAKNMGTMGARAMTAYYERFEGNKKMNAADYAATFEELYRAGAAGISYKNAQSMPRLEQATNRIGMVAAKAAIDSGLRDRRIAAESDTARLKKLRVPGQKNSANSRTYVADGVSIEFDDNTMNVLDAIAVKTGREIVITDKLPEDVNGMYSGNRILLNKDLSADYMPAVALHEAVHGAKVYAPQEYRALEEFITNYLAAQGIDVDQRLYELARRYGTAAPNEDVLREELVCQTVMAIAADENAFDKAVRTKENAHLLEKVRDALKGIAQRIRDFFNGIADGGRIKHNKEAAAMLDDADALDKMAEKISALLDRGREVRAETGDVESGERYAKKDTHNKYSDKTIDEYTRAQYNCYGWVVINKVLTVNELNRFYKEFANEEMLQFKYKKSYDGYYMIPTGDVSMHDSKIVFVAGTSQDPYINRVLEINGINRKESNFWINEVIDHAEYDNSYEDIETYAGDGILRTYTPEDFASYSELKNRHNAKGSEYSGETRNGTKNAQNDSGSVKSQERLTNSDPEYFLAVERGDMRAAQKLVDEAAKKAGYNIKAFHSSPNKFTVFKKGERAGLSGKGIYFSSYEQNLYGDNRYDVYLKMEKPMTADNEPEGAREVSSNGTLMGIIPDFYDRFPQFDGIIRRNEMTVKDPEQIKSSEPITYDDDGKIIPLSKRFDKEKSDIRYALDDSYTDDFWLIDDDLFEEDNRKMLDRLLEQSPDEAVMAMYNSTAKTAEGALRGYRSIKLSDDDYKTIARRIMRQYQIKEKHNPGAVKEIAERVAAFVGSVGSDKKTDFISALDVLAKDCKGFINMAGDLTIDPFKEAREYVTGLIRGKKLILPERSKSQIIENYGSMKNLRRAFFGYVNVVDQQNNRKNSRVFTGEDGMYIEDIIDHVRERYGEAFVPEGTDSMNGWAWLDNLLHNVLQPQFYNPYYDSNMQEATENADSASLDMAFGIISEAVKTKAEKAVTGKNADRKTIKELTASNKRIAAERDAYHKAKQEQYLKLYESAKAAKKKAVMKRELALEENDILKAFIASETKNVRQQYIESREKTLYIERLGKEYKRMAKMLDGKAKSNEYIPDKLKAPILDLLALFKAEPAPYKNGKERKLPKYWGEYNNLEDIGLRLLALKDEYAKIKSRVSEDKGKNKNWAVDYDLDSLGYEQGVYDALGAVAEMVKGKNIYALDSFELKGLYNAMRELDGALKRSVEIIIDGKKTIISRAGAEAFDVISRSKKSADGYNPAKWAADTLKATSLDPVRFGRYLSGYREDSVVYKLFRDLHEGDKKRVRIMQQAFIELERTLNTFSDKEKKALQTEDVSEFEFIDRNTGKRVRVSRGVIISLYLTARQAAGYRHLVNDKYNHYTRLPDLKMSNLDKVPVVGGTAASAVSAKSRALGAKSHEVQLGAEDIRHINRYVEGDEKLLSLANAVSDVFNGIIKDELNKVSMEREGRLLATVKDYFPLVTDSDAPDKQYSVEFDEVFKDARMKSRGFTKQRTYSENSIVIDDVLNVFARHVEKTAEYCGMIIPTETFKKVYNSNAGGTDTVRGVIKKKYGDSAEKYINKLMGDIQERKDTKDENIFTRLHGNYMGAVLMANPGSALKQFAMYPMANRYFGMGNVARAAFVGGKTLENLIEKYTPYTPYMWYREQGNGTVIAETSRQVGFTKKWSDKFDLMGRVDRRVVNSVLYAAEQHVKQTKKLEYDSEAFKQEVARQFERCMDEIQPNNMVTSKPQFVRNNVLRILSMNAFVSQNMAMGNCVMDSYMEWRARSEDFKQSKSDEARAELAAAKKKFFQTVWGVMQSGMLLGVLSTISSFLLFHKRDDLKDEKGMFDPWKLLGSWADETLDSIFGVFAWGDKIYNIITSVAMGKYFFRLEAMGLTGINDLVESIQNGNYAKAWATFADMAGIPVLGGSNIQRALGSVNKYLEDGVAGDLGESFFGYTVAKNNGAIDFNHFGYYIVHEIKQGDKGQAEKYVNLWRAELVSQGKSESEANEAIKKKISAALADEDEVVQAATALMNGEYAKHNELVNKVAAQGFDTKDVSDAANKVIGNVKTDMKERGITDRDEIRLDLMDQGINETGAARLASEWAKEEDAEAEAEADVFGDTDSGSMYKYNDAFEALANGDTESYELIADYLVEHGKKKSREEVDKEVKSKSRTYKLWIEYMEGETQEKRDKARQKLVNIYGSEGAARAALAEYAKKKEKK